MFLFPLSGRDRHKPLYRDGRCDSDIQRAARLQRRGGGRGLQRKTQDSKYIVLNDLPLIRSPSQQGYIGGVDGEDFNERQAYIVFYNHPFVLPASQRSGLQEESQDRKNTGYFSTIFSYQKGTKPQPISVTTVSGNWQC